MKKLMLFVWVLLFSTSSFAETSWLLAEVHISLQKILMNISPQEADPGCVVAAQSRDHPDYYYHWVRDAALTMDAVVSEYQHTVDQAEKSILKQKLLEYLDFSIKLQDVQSSAGLGEPKFNVDGSLYAQPWARPQNDSPALRAISFIHWYLVLEKEDSTDGLRRKLYDGKLPTESVIKKDLEYISHHWQDPSFDLWEEVKGDHFYTRMVQRRALIEGSQLAESVGDDGAAQWYLQQAQEIEKSILDFWDDSKGYFVATKNYVEGVDYKVSNLDTAVILGLLHGHTDDGFLSFDDPRVQSTIQKIVDAFTPLYLINRQSDIPGVAIGRYPEDLYGGDNFNGGNPWPLCTLAIAEVYYKTAAILEAKGQLEGAREFVQAGDEFVGRVEYHSNADGSLSEQMDRDTGFMVSAQDLTWNYAAILTTSFVRLSRFTIQKVN